jgi:hypothetical protein
MGEEDRMIEKLIDITFSFHLPWLIMGALSIVHYKFMPFLSLSFSILHSSLLSSFFCFEN